MLKRLIFAVLLIPFILILTQCSSDESGTNSTDPPAGISGIRLTDKLGNILTGDSLDWCFPETLSVVPSVSPGLVPAQYKLYPAYPNPNDEPDKRDITIIYDLPIAGDVDMYIINQSENIVRTLVDAAQTSGRYAVEWDQLDDKGQILDTGIYRCVLTAGDFECTGDIEIDVLVDHIMLYATVSNDTMNVSYDSPVKVGAILMRFGINGTTEAPIYDDITSNMVTITSPYTDSLKITILPDIGEYHALPAGENQLVSIPFEGSMTLDSADVSDSLGVTMPALIINQ